MRFILYNNSVKGWYKMTLAQKLVNNFEMLTDIQKIEVIDFIDFLINKNKKNTDLLMDEVITENHEALMELSK